MGSRYREPRPRSPERIRLRSIDSARFEEHDGYVDDSVTIQATFTYYTWCCHDSHEIVDAVAALERAIQDAHDRSEKKRLKKSQEEHAEVLREISGQSEI